MDIPTHKMVDGKVVELTADEVREISCDWIEGSSSPDSIFEAKMMKGYDTSLGWHLPIDDASRQALSELRVQITEGLSLGVWTNNSTCPVKLRATDGSLHDGTIGEVRVLIFEAGNYYAQLVEARRAAQNG